MTEQAQAQGSDKFFHMPRFQTNYQKPNFYQTHAKQAAFQNATMGNMTFDGKRLRKSVYRKTIDYNTSVMKMLESRIWQRDHRDKPCIQADVLYHSELMPPLSLLSNPINAVTSKHVRTSTNKMRCPVFCVVWTPEGRRLITGASSGEFTLWNGLTFNFETILQAHDTAVRSMIWSHNDHWMLTADHGGYVKYWQSNMNNVKMYQAHKEAIRGLSFCPTDSKYASCSDDGTVRVWDFLHCHEERVLRGHGADVKCLDWHPQKSLIASGSKDSQQPIKLWDPRSGQGLATLHAHKNTVMSLKWNRNGNWLLTASRDHLIKVFDIRNMREDMQTFKGHKKEATTLAWHPIHEGMFASGGSDGAIMFWLVGSDKEVGAMDEAHDAIIWGMDWHPLGHILVSGSNDHCTKFWTRNRPGDIMDDKYNLNLLPQGVLSEEADAGEDNQTMASIPGMGLEHGVAEHLQAVKTNQDGIPGFDWSEEDKRHLMSKQRMQKVHKLPKARPVPKSFEAAWEGKIAPPGPPDISQRPPSLLDLPIQNGRPGEMLGPNGDQGRFGGPPPRKPGEQIDDQNSGFNEYGDEPPDWQEDRSRRHDRSGGYNRDRGGRNQRGYDRGQFGSPTSRQPLLPSPDDGGRDRQSSQGRPALLDTPGPGGMKRSWDDGPGERQDRGPPPGYGRDRDRDWDRERDDRGQGRGGYHGDRGRGGYQGDRRGGYQGERGPGGYQGDRRDRGRGRGRDQRGGSPWRGGRGGRGH